MDRLGRRVSTPRSVGKTEVWSGPREKASVDRSTGPGCHMVGRSVGKRVGLSAYAFLVRRGLGTCVEVVRGSPNGGQMAGYHCRVTPSSTSHSSLSRRFPTFQSRFFVLSLRQSTSHFGRYPYTASYSSALAVLCIGLIFVFFARARTAPWLTLHPSV